MSRVLLNWLICVAVVVGGLQVVQAQKADPQLLEKLIRVSSEGHAFRQGLPEWIKPPSPDPAKVAARFDPALADDTQLTAEQKQFVKANYDKLAVRMHDKLLGALGQHLKFDDWLTAYLRETYPKELTTAEMNEWIAYFGTSEGKLTRKTIFAVPQPTDPESQALLAKFEKAPIGIKFIKIFGDDLNAHIQTRMSSVETVARAELDKVLAPVELQKMFHQFVAENYKQP